MANTKGILTVLLTLLVLGSGLADVFVPQVKGEVSVLQKSLDLFRNVIGIDLSRYSVDVAADIKDAPAIYGGRIRETLTINLNSAANRIQGCFMFLDGTYIYCTISSLQGRMIYTQPFPASNLNRAKELLHRYEQFSNKTNLQDMVYLLDSVSVLQTTVKAERNLSVTIDTHGGNNLISVSWYSIVNGIAFPTGLFLQINRDDVIISDQTKFVRIGSATLRVTASEAVQIGMETAKKITVKVMQQDGSFADEPFALQNEPLSIFLRIAYREPFTEYPQWYMFFGNDGSQNQEGGVEVDIWAYNGEVALCQRTHTFYHAPSLNPLPTPSQNPIPSATSQPTQTSTLQSTPTPSPSPILTPASPSASIPEFPTWIVLPLALLTTLMAFAVMFRKRISKDCQNKS